MEIKQLYQSFIESTGVSIDTRTLKKDNIFFALSGPNFNGNAYAKSALELGASFVVIDDEEYLVKEHKNYLFVDNTLRALQDLARHHRNTFDIPIIGLTGSNGKTTTKELLAACLACKHNTLFTHGNLNNHIGVPLTLLNLDDTHEIAIIEMGANHVGEIAELAHIALPTHGFITNIGNAHLEGFGSQENILKAKCELYDFLDESGGVIFYNPLDEMILTNITRYHSTNAVELISSESLTSAGLSLTIHVNGENIHTHLVGSYNLMNVNAALSIGRYFDVPLDEMLNAIKAYIPSMNRSQFVEREGYHYVLDAYNANPSSVGLSLESFAKLKDTHNKCVVLGDMFELGEASIPLHLEVVQKAIDLGFKSIYLVGPNYASASSMLLNDSITNIYAFNNFDDVFIQSFNSMKSKDDIYLVKGSRSMKMERLIEIG